MPWYLLYLMERNHEKSTMNIVPAINIK